MIKKAEIDNGRGFDWGRTSQDYAKYRVICSRFSFLLNLVIKEESMLKTSFHLFLQ